MKLNMNFTFMSVLASTLALASLAPIQAAEPSLGDLSKAVAELQAEVAQLKAAAAEGARLAELERRIDLLAAELEKARSGGATESSSEATGSQGFGPAASKIYRKDRGVSIGGYGEALYQGGDEHSLDDLRNIVYIGYKFSDRMLFNSEIEFEHASTGEGAEERGEVSVEFAYLDYKPWRNVGFRAGHVLIPLGFLNELHEPPIFSGARRPAVEGVILPTTWHEVGAGLFGESGPFTWRGYLVAGLNSQGFDAGQGIREGRQSGSQSRARDVAFTGRLDYTGAPGLLAGGSFFSGKSGQGVELKGVRIGGQVTTFDLHVQYERRGLQLRGLYARTSIGDAALIDAQNGLSGEGESVGERQYGFYVQAAYDLLNHRHGGWAVTPFVRYERLDTQDRVPAGYTRDRANDRRVVSAGVGLKPLFNVVLKADYQWQSNKADERRNQFNLAVGYLF
jgi:hypothetical protein